MDVQTRLSALALPLALLLALAQGGSCAGGANAVGNANADRKAASNKKQKAKSNANADTNRNANRAGDAREDDSAVTGEETAGRGVAARGVWGGRGVQLEVGSGGAQVEFDCAHGRIESLALDAEGNFDARGVIVMERGGPAHVGEREDERPARFAGKVSGQTMTLTVTPEGGEPWETPFKLTLGGAARLRKCL